MLCLVLASVELIGACKSDDLADSRFTILQVDFFTKAAATKKAIAGGVDVYVVLIIIFSAADRHNGELWPRSDPEVIPKWTRNGPEMDQNGPEMDQNGPEMDQNGPEVDQNGPEVDQEMRWSTSGPHRVHFGTIARVAGPPSASAAVSSSCLPCACAPSKAYRPPRVGCRELELGR